MKSLDTSSQNQKSFHLRFVTILTFARVPLVLAFLAGAIAYTKYDKNWLFTLTFTLLITAAVTDFFDGYFARKFNVVTKLGGYADPLMDKFFYIATMPVLVFVATKNENMGHAVFLLVLTVFFLARDQWVTFLRSIGSIYNASGKASWTGKVRTCLNFPVICVAYHIEESPIQIVNKNLLYVFEAIAFIVNIVSVYTYTRHYWPYLRKSAQTEDS